MSDTDVLLPVRAPSPWLEHTLDGLRRQSLSNFRLVVLLHGEDAEARRLVQTAFPQSDICALDPQLAFPDVLNFGLRHSTADFIARIDADDVPVPARLERQRSILLDRPTVDIVATAVRLIDETGTPLGLQGNFPDTEALLRRLRWKNSIAHSSVMYRREAALRAGGYNAAAKHAEDYDLWLRLISPQTCEYLHEPLTRYRLHPEQVTRTSQLDARCAQTIGTSRREYAMRRGDSIGAADIRQFVWWMRQKLRRLTTTLG